jgi:hypothetical protein
MSYGDMGNLADSDWTTSNGVAKPDTVKALEIFKQLQRNCNRLLGRDNQPLIAVDGRIGGQTARALTRYWNDKWPIDRAELADVDAIAATADVIVGILYMQAITTGAPGVPDPNSGSPVSVASGSQVVNPSDAAIAAGPNGRGGSSFTQIISSPLGMAAAVVGVLLVARSMGKGKKKR